MPHRRLARVLVVVLIAIPLVATSAWGTPRRLPSELQPFEFLARLWGSFAALWEAEGCSIDPHGGCTSGQTPTTDSGCSLDPHGGCAGAQGEAPIPPPTTDEGCNLDPHGGCNPGS